MSLTIQKDPPLTKGLHNPNRLVQLHRETGLTPQNSPTYLPMNVAAKLPAKPHRAEIQGILPDKRRVPHGWPTCLRKQPSRVAFKNNDIYIYIYMINDEESNTYEELKERHSRVFYKLKVSKNPASKNMPHEEDFDEDNYKSIDETVV